MMLLWEMKYVNGQKPRRNVHHLLRLMEVVNEEAWEPLPVGSVQYYEPLLTNMAHNLI